MRTVLNTTFSIAKNEDHLLGLGGGGRVGGWVGISPVCLRNTVRKNNCETHMGGVNHFSGNVRGVSPSKMLKEVGKTLP